MKNLMFKLGNLTTLFAMAVVVDVASRTCLVMYHQPKLPESAKKLRKF